MTASAEPVQTGAACSGSATASRPWEASYRSRARRAAGPTSPQYCRCALTQLTRTTSAHRPRRSPAGARRHGRHRLPRSGASHSNQRMSNQGAADSERAKETRFQELLESAPDAVVLVGAKGRINLVNRRTEELFGYEPGELIDREVELLVPDRLRAGHLAHRAGYVADPRT